MSGSATLKIVLINDSEIGYQFDFTAGNATPDSNRFSAGGQTNNQHFIRNGGGNESPGKLIWILDKKFPV